jgi:hypothetical protein
MKNKLSCKQCTYFDSDNSFCRRFPPTPVVIKRDGKQLVVSKYPVIQMPNVDYCGEIRRGVL